jgi:hypothetical protein
MLKNDKPDTLIQLLAAYRPAQFPTNRPTAQDLGALATVIRRNCALTVGFADRKLRNLQEDGEEAFTLFALKEEAIVLKGRCDGILDSRRRRNLSLEVASLQGQYDNFTDSVHHLFRLLDRVLAGRLDEVL